MHKQNEKFNRDRNYNKEPVEILELKNIMNVTKNVFKNINSRLEKAEESICELEET